MTKEISEDDTIALARDAHRLFRSKIIVTSQQKNDFMLVWNDQEG